MNIAQFKQVTPGLTRTVVTGVQRLLKKWQIWRIDQQYLALGRYADELVDAQIYAEHARRALLLRRGQELAALRTLGGR